MKSGTKLALVGVDAFRLGYGAGRRRGRREAYQTRLLVGKEASRARVSTGFDHKQHARAIRERR